MKVRPLLVDHTFHPVIAGIGKLIHENIKIMSLAIIKKMPAKYLSVSR